MTQRSRQYHQRLGVSDKITSLSSRLMMMFVPTSMSQRVLEAIQRSPRYYFEKNPLITFAPSSSFPDGQLICLSPQCVQTASYLLSAMDPTAQPCQDFFQFACGSWNRKHFIPEDRHDIELLRHLDWQNNLIPAVMFYLNTCLSNSLWTGRRYPPSRSWPTSNRSCSKVSRRHPLLSNGWSASCYHWNGLILKIGTFFKARNYEFWMTNVLILIMNLNYTAHSFRNPRGGSR